MITKADVLGCGAESSGLLLLRMLALSSKLVFSSCTPVSMWCSLTYQGLTRVCLSCFLWGCLSPTHAKHAI